jgi:cell division septal protein FtsQ
VKVYPKIVGMHESDVEYIDLRYSNGIAVKWKGENKAQPA